MNRSPNRIDAGVVIGRVHVGARTDGPRTPSRESLPAARHPRAGDQRIMVGTLRVETDAVLQEPEARRLGGRIAQALADRLRALQERRLDALLSGRSRGGAVRIQTLRVVLRGDEAARPDAGAIAAALSNAVERGCRS